MISRVLKALPLGLLVATVGVAMSFLYLFHEIEENIGLGLLFKLRGLRQPPPDAVVVSIDKDSSEHLGVPENPDKWPRSLHARLVEEMAREGAKVVTFDVHFLEPRSPLDDKLLSEAFDKAGNVVIADALSAKEVPLPDNGSSYAAEHSIVKIIKPFAPFAQSALATAPFVLPRIPFKVNQYWTFQTEAGDSATFPVVTLQLFSIDVYDDFINLLEKARPSLTGKLPRDINATIKSIGIQKLIRDIRDIFASDASLADRMLQDLERSNSLSATDGRRALLHSLIRTYGGGSRLYANYYGPPRTIPTIPYYRALQLGESSDSGKSVDVKGKAVFVGLSERLLAERKDSFYTVFSQANGVFIGGVEIAATAFLNMLHDTSVKPISSLSYVLTILLWGLVLGIVCRASSVMLAGSSLAALTVLYLLGAEYQFSANGVWFPITIPLFVQSPLAFFGAVLWNYVETNKERQHIRKALAYYVPDEVVDQLAKNIVDIKNSGQMVYGACLFADVAGYTTLSEKMTPQELSDLMHKYFEATFEPVKKHGGLVVNLKGDSFLAIWKGARAEDALRQHACLAAWEVAKAVQRFNGSHDSLNLPTRVAVHSGQIFLGNIGAGDHYEYGPTGDTVNTASRLDSLNKHLGTEVLASEEIVQQVESLVTREVGKFLLRGKSQAIVVHEILGPVGESDEKRKQASVTFADALAAFRRQRWDEAREKFQRILENCENDGPAQFYLKLCERYDKIPLEDSWDGAVVLDEK
jgi:adenylate cyclase